MNRRSWAEKPYEDIREEVAAKQDNVSNAVIEKEKRGPEEKQWKGVGEEVYYVAMDQRRDKNTDDAKQSSRSDAEKSEVYASIKLHREDKPHEEDQAKRNY